MDKSIKTLITNYPQIKSYYSRIGVFDLAKILQFVTYFSAKTGGEFTICYNLSKRLADIGHEVTIITTDVLYDSEIKRTIPNINIIPFHCIANVAGFLYTPSMNKWLRAHIHEYDVIHVHGYRSYQTNIISAYAKKVGIPYVIQPHGSFPRIVEKQTLKRLYDKVWGYTALENAEKIIAVVESERDSLVSEGFTTSKISVIYNGLNTEGFSLTSLSGENIDLERPLVIYVGRLHPIKGVDFLIKAFSYLLQSIPSVRLRIVGTGDEKYVHYLQNLVGELEIEQNVIFVGHSDELIQEYSSADLLIYPSVYEIFGLVPFEALLCGTPVIVSDDCGCGKIIGEQKCGTLVKYGDISNLSTLIESALRNYSSCLEQVKRGQQYIHDELAWNKVVWKFVSVYGLQ